VPRKHHLRDLLERLTLILRADDRRTPGLLPTHRALLRYLGRANRYSNTPGAAALFLGQTKGTVSQSIALLERRGWNVEQQGLFGLGYFHQQAADRAAAIAYRQSRENEKKESDNQ